MKVLWLSDKESENEDYILCTDIESVKQKIEESEKDIGYQYMVNNANMKAMYLSDNIIGIIIDTTAFHENQYIPLLHWFQDTNRADAYLIKFFNNSNEDDTIKRYILKNLNLKSKFYCIKNNIGIWSSSLSDIYLFESKKQAEIIQQETCINEKMNSEIIELSIKIPIDKDETND